MKTFLTEKHNIPEGATHYSDECENYHFTWFAEFNGGEVYLFSNSTKEWKLSLFNRELKPIPQTNIETPEEKEALDNMKQRNKQSEMCKPLWAKWSIGDTVTKTKGSSWTGKVVGYYQTDLTSKGYAVESSTEKGSVQIYPEAALSDLEQVEPESSEWNGEGLPPVGVECEYKDGVGWYEVKVKYLSEWCMVIEALKSQGKWIDIKGTEIAFDHSRLDSLKFRKLETPQQREDREREEARAGIELLLEGNINSNNSALPKTISRIIHDAGYRKEG